MGLIGVATLTACSGAPVRWKASETLETLSPSVVVIYPFRFRWVEPKWRTYQKSRDLVSATLAEGRFLVIGPEELTVYRPEDPNVLAASTLLPRLMELGLTPKDAVVLRAWAEERREKSSRVTYDAKGRPVGRKLREERLVIVHLQVVDVAGGKILLEGHQAIPFDPMEIQPDFDPLHPLTEALGELTTAALKKLQGPGAERPASGLVLVTNPASASPRGNADPLQAELLQLGFFTYFDASWGPSDRKAMIRAGHGARVQKVSGAAVKAGLREGDIIVACNDMSVTGPETVLRHLSRAASGVRLELRRESQTLQVVLPREGKE